MSGVSCAPSLYTVNQHKLSFYNWSLYKYQLITRVKVGNLDKSVIGRNAKKPKSNPELNVNQKLIKTNILRVGQATLKLLCTYGCISFTILLVKHYNDSLDRQNSRLTNNEVTCFYVVDVFCIP